MEKRIKTVKLFLDCSFGNKVDPRAGTSQMKSSYHGNLLCLPSLSASLVLQYSGERILRSLRSSPRAREKTSGIERVGNARKSIP